MQNFVANVVLADRAQTVQLVGALVAADYEVENPIPSGLIVAGTARTQEEFASTLEEYLPADAIIDDCGVAAW